MPASMSEEADIQWGTIHESASKAKIFYSSFFSEGVEYKLYDNVEVFSEENEEPYIGKIIKLWDEKQSGLKKVLIRWFLRLRDLDPEMEGDPKELYLAFGKGKGVTNENDLEVICGKCKVLCTSKDARNKQPSASDLKNADFFFSKIYNVDLQHLSPVQRVVDKLGYEAVFNKQEWVTEISKNKEEQFKQPKPVPNSIIDTLSKQEAQYTPNLQKDSGRDTEQKVSQGSVLKRHQTANAEEVAKKKKFKTSASTSPTTVPARGMQKEEKVNEVIVCKNLKLDGPELQSKTDLPAFTLPQIEAKSNLEKSSSLKRTAVVEAIKVDRREVQSKSDLPDCAPPQLKLKSSNVEKSSSFKKYFVNEVTSPKVEAALERAVTNSKSSRQLAEMESISDQMDLPACTLPQIEAKPKLEKSSSLKKTAVVEAIKVDRQEVQSKLDLPVCAPPQLKLKSSNVEKLSSFKKAFVNEITSPKVDAALERAVTKSKGSRQLAEMESLSKADQSATEAVATLLKGDNDLGQAVTESNNSRQLADTSSLPKADQSSVKAVGLDSPKRKENISEVQRDSSTGEDNYSGIVEADKSKRSSTLNFKREAEVTAQVTAPAVNLSLEERNDQEKVNLSPIEEPEGSVKDFATKEEKSNVIKKPKLGTGSDIEKKSILTLEPVKERKMFKKLPWEENLQQGLNFGKVLLLQNLDPFLTSADVCDMLTIILQGVSDVRIIPQETACPYGQALAIFDSRMLADSALQEMERKCLVLQSSKRPLIASKFKETTNLTRFPGHLALDKLKLSRNLGADDYKKAVSTSHSSQPNTIEYEMAMEWRRLQEITQTCRVELFEKQRKEIEEIRNGCNRKGF